MNLFRKSLVVLVAVVPLVLMHVSSVGGAGPKVSEDKNKHNLSSGSITNYNPLVFTVGRDNSIIYKAKSVSDGGVPAGQQICIFCHTPHNANVDNQAPLWNRKFSDVTNFQRYSSGTLQIRLNSAISAADKANYGTGWQPDGATKLCLSCHDGVSNLGAVLRGGDIAMDPAGDALTEGNRVSGRASFNPSTNKMKLGHHPVSFVYSGTVQQAISSARLTDGFKLPAVLSPVKLDKNNKMQCTTCHNAHQNQSVDTSCYDDATGTLVAACGAGYTRKVAPFWVWPGSNATSDHDDVCKSCHKMTMGNDPKVPWP